MTDLLFYGRLLNAMSSMLQVRMEIGPGNNIAGYKTAVNLCRSKVSQDNYNHIWDSDSL